MINKIKNIDFNKIINKIKNIDFNKIIDKIKGIKLEDIKEFLINYGNGIITYIFLVLLLGLLGLSIFTSINIYTSYNEIQKNNQQIELVDNNAILDKIKKNNLRDLDTISVTYYLLLNSKYPNIKELEQVKKDIKYILGYIKSKTRNYKDSSDIIYLNSFPNIIKYKSKLSRKVKNYTLLSKVINNLYIYELLLINNKQKKISLKYENFYKKTQAPYNYFLKYIYFPEQGIWRDKFSGKIDIDIFGGNYLKKAKDLDINLISYWSSYFSKAYKGKLYGGDENIIDSIKVGKFSNEDKLGLTKLPINVKFGVINDNSFYGLMSKLTSSNIKNTMNVYKFTYLLWNNIQDHTKNILNNNSKYISKLSIGEKYIDSILYKCIVKGKFNELGCDELLGCKDKNLCSVSNFKGLTEKNLFSSGFQNTYNIIFNKLANNSNYDINDSFFTKYYKNEYYKINDINKLIGANLYSCIFDDNGYCRNLFGYDDKVIKKTIIDFIGSISCTIDNITDVCKASFIQKFDTNYFIGYTLVSDLGRYSNYPLTDRLKDVYKNISGLISLGSFTFRKVNNIVADSNIKYNSDVSLLVYYKGVTNKYINDILSYIGENKCSKVTLGKKWNIDLILKFVNKKINNLYKLSDNNLAVNTVVDLNKIKAIIEDLKKELSSANNLHKVLLNIQLYRIMKEYGYCN